MNLRDAYRILELAQAEYKRIHLTCERQREMIARQREMLSKISSPLISADGDNKPLDKPSTEETRELDKEAVAAE
ncbi:MAG TPA: hypothetical protein VJS44_05065 [Pyrinomonadaceae bacterium]|nr:hypothetical protein [Pyrinomonadaceae bacterium]